MKTVESLLNLQSHLEENKNSFLLLYKSGSEQSECALSNLQNVSTNLDTLNILIADVVKVRDIHPAYNINSVPTLLEFTGTELKNISKGCNNADQLKSIFSHKSYEGSANTKAQKNVTVYSTPTCSWCTTLKTYLRDHNIRFRDIDVSANQQLAMQMVKKSGQQGVPQTEINGQMIVGFDRDRINRLLEINN